jgi:hypothetical protein
MITFVWNPRSRSTGFADHLPPERARRTWFETIEEIQAVLDTYLEGYKHASQHPSVYAIEEKRFC